MFDVSKCPYAPCGKHEYCIGCKFDPECRKQQNMENIEDDIYAIDCSTCEKRGVCEERTGVTVYGVRNACKNYRPNENTTVFLYNHWDDDTYPVALGRAIDEARGVVRITIDGENRTDYFMWRSDACSMQLDPNVVKEKCVWYEITDDDGEVIRCANNNAT